MKTDRELLELAAKAAGITGEWERDDAYIQERYVFIIPYSNHGLMTGIPWNPLKDDGDALRLAVNLGLTVESNANDGDCAAYEPRNVRAASVEWGGMDDAVRLAATRRAIVRAAAAIGESM